ncbi:MAG TPA: LysR family transcriptional regulator [Novosphingobium sp.]|nr:LysR family transcriptional regulator [Novosphingobium sp.]
MAHEKLRDLDLNLLIVLEALLRCQNVSRAADELDMSQSSVSHALKRLRVQFDDPLFTRSREGMAPTPKAVEIADYIFEIMRLTRNTLLPSPSFDPETSDRALRLALGDVGDMLILPSLVRHMRQHKANGRIISLPVGSEEATELMANGKLDIYVGIMEATSADILCQKLYEDRLVFICSAQSALCGEISFEEYNAMEHIALQSRATFKSTKFISDVLEPADGRKNLRVETPHIAAIPMIIAQDERLIAAVPASLANHFRTVADINVLQPKFYMPNISINQYWHKRFDKDKFLIWSRRSLKKICQNLGQGLI